MNLPLLLPVQYRWKPAKKLQRCRSSSTVFLPDDKGCRERRSAENRRQPLPQEGQKSVDVKIPVFRGPLDAANGARFAARCIRKPQSFGYLVYERGCEKGILRRYLRKLCYIEFYFCLIWFIYLKNSVFRD